MLQSVVSVRLERERSLGDMQIFPDRSGQTVVLIKVKQHRFSHFGVNVMMRIQQTVVNRRRKHLWR